MGQARWWVGAVVSAGLLLACHLRKEAVVDAGREEDSGGILALAEAAAANGPLELSSDAQAPDKHVSVHCATGEVAVLFEGEETCVVECKSTAECPPAWTCDAEGPISHAGRPGNVIHYCRNAAHGKPPDAGASRTGPDAGHPAAADAGAGTKRFEHHDAGPKAK